MKLREHWVEIRPLKWEGGQWTRVTKPARRELAQAKIVNHKKKGQLSCYSLGMLTLNTKRAAGRRGSSQLESVAALMGPTWLNSNNPLRTRPSALTRNPSGQCNGVCGCTCEPFY